MAKLPRRPSLERLREIGPEVEVVGAGTMLYKIYARGGRHPSFWDQFRSFGPVTTNRFDHHPEPAREHAEYGIVYAALQIDTCIAEFFQDTRTIDRRHGEPWLAGFRLTRDVGPHSLRGKWPTRAGASMNINSGPRPHCRRWSRTIYEVYEEIEGILYCSSMNAGAEALALYERARDALPENPRINIPLSHPAIRFELERIAEELGYDDLR